MSNTKSNVLVMEFKDVEGKVKSIRVANPKEDLSAATVEAAMELINNLNVFYAITGFGPATLKGAKTVQTVTSNFNIEIS